ncbi:MAG: VWA domain-containing protein [Candidatus Sulfotelmatobacter sp.]
MAPRRVILLLALLISIPWAGASIHAQTGANNPTTLKTKSQLVLVDVVVTNDKGAPISGLQKKDFAVLEDGKPQTISSFEEHHGAPITQIQLPPLPPHVYTNFPLVQSADSVNIILLDALNTPARDQVYVRSQMLQYLKTIPRGTRVAIFTLASQLRMLQGLTTDSTELAAALDSTKAAQQSALLPSDAENDANQRRIDFLIQEEQGPPPKTLGASAVDPVQAAKQFIADTAAFETTQRIEITLQAMQQLARYLTGVPGRKNVIWFSGSFPTAIFGDPDLPDPFNIAASFQDEIRKTTDLLSSAQLALYPIAAEGLTSDAIFQANGSEIGQKRPSLAMRDQVKQMNAGQASRDLNHSAMEDLAKDTGGEAYYNTNGLSGALARVINNGTRYYSLAYSPTNAAMDGKFRRIQVKLVNSKGTLAYRRGYYADDLATALSAGQKPASDPLLSLMGRNLPDYTQILYKVLVQPSNPQPAADAPHIGSNTELKGPFTRYSVDFAISLGDLKLDPAPDGARHGSIEVVLLAYSREGKPLNFVVTQGNVALQAKEYESVRKGGLQIHKEIDVPKGYAYLRTGVYDFKSSNAGTLGLPLTDTVTTAAK